MHIFIQLCFSSSQKCTQGSRNNKNVISLVKFLPPMTLNFLHENFLSSSFYPTQ